MAAIAAAQYISVATTVQCNSPETTIQKSADGILELHVKLVGPVQKYWY